MKRILERALGFIQGRSRADPCQNYMAVSVNWGPFVGVLIMRTPLFGVCIRSPVFLGRLPYPVCWDLPGGFLRSTYGLSLLVVGASQGVTGMLAHDVHALGILVVWSPSAGPLFRKLS